MVNKSYYVVKTDFSMAPLNSNSIWYVEHQGLWDFTRPYNAAWAQKYNASREAYKKKRASQQKNNSIDKSSNEY